MLVEIILDLRSFFLVVIILLIGFNLIFYRLSEDDNSTFGNELLNTYIMLYSQYDYLGYDAPQVFFFVVVTVVLSMILFNMLIAVMNDTFNRVQSRRKVAECKEKIKLVFESVVIKRTYRRMLCSKKLKRDNSINYLFMVEEREQEVQLNAKNELTTRINKLEKQLERVNEVVSHKLEKLPETIEKLLQQELNKFQQQIKVDSPTSMKNEKIDPEEWDESTKNCSPV